MHHSCTSTGCLNCCKSKHGCDVLCNLLDVTLHRLWHWLLEGQKVGMVLQKQLQDFPKCLLKKKILKYPKRSKSKVKRAGLQYNIIYLLYKFISLINYIYWKSWLSKVQVSKSQNCPYETWSNCLLKINLPYVQSKTKKKSKIRKLFIVFKVSTFALRLVQDKSPFALEISAALLLVVLFCQYSNSCS